MPPEPAAGGKRGWSGWRDAPPGGRSVRESERRGDMKTITKKSLIDRIADETGQKRVDVKKTVQHFLDHVIEELGEGNRLEFRDFGVFEVRRRAERTAQNPKTLERVVVPARHTAKFKVGRRMREALEALDRAHAEQLEVTIAPGVSNGSLAARNGHMSRAEV